MVPIAYRYNHLGLPTEQQMPGMVHLPHLKLHATDHEANPFGIQWMRYDPDCTLPLLVRTMAHAAFEVDDLQEALQGKKVIIQPTRPPPACWSPSSRRPGRRSS